MPGFRTRRAIAISGGEILATGTDAELRALVGSRTETLDLRGTSVIPGINDSHLHAMWWSLGSPPLTLDVGHPTVKSIADIAESVRRAVSDRAPGTWIQGRGWDQSYFADRRAPTRADLDIVSPNHPVLLTEFSGHAIWVNSKALELAGITRTTEAPQGGVIVKDQQGEPTGVFFEAAAGLVRSKLPELRDADRAHAIDLAMDRIAAAGITSFTEPGLDPASIRIYLDKARARALKARPTLLVRGSSSLAELERILAELRPVSDVDPRLIRVAGIKLFADGIPTINKTAWVSEPYVGGGHGELVTHGESDQARVAELQAMIRAAHAAGWQIGTHATGDRAIDAVVEGYLTAQASAPAGNRDPRHYVIHSDLVSPATLERMASGRIGANFNAAIKHLIVDGQVKSLGPSRAGYEWPYRSALRAGVVVASGSDAPVTDGNWGRGLAMCVTRKGNQSGAVFGPEERISLDEAIATYTSGGAWQDHAEAWKGMLKPGYAADLCVLDRSLPGIEPNELPGLTVTMTVMDGRVVYRKS